MPSTVPAWISVSRWEASALQRKIRVLALGGSPRQFGFASMTISEPRFHSLRRYGPVPLSSVTIAWLSALAGSILALSHSVSLIANEVNAILDRNATSGTQSSKTTVLASIAEIFLNSPV